VLPDPGVGRGRDDVPVLALEQSPIVSRAELLHVLPKKANQLGRDRHEPHLALLPLFEAPPVVRLPESVHVLPAEGRVSATSIRPHPTSGKVRSVNRRPNASPGRNAA
jgi:hypothetical protein